GVGPRSDDGGDVGDADVALAGSDALDGVGRALAAKNLHVKPFLAVPTLLESGVMRHVLPGRHEVEDERIRLYRQLRAGEAPERQHDTNCQQRDTPPNRASHTRVLPARANARRHCWSSAYHGLGPRAIASHRDDGHGQRDWLPTRFFAAPCPRSSPSWLRRRCPP